MALVDYSGSDESDADEKAAVPGPAASKIGSKKPGFQKFVDQAEPAKIRVNLPGQTDQPADNASDPPAKKVKTSAVGLGGFNSFLPAPKRAAGATGPSKGLGKMVNLKTGASPGFTREPMDLPQADHTADSKEKLEREETSIDPMMPSNPVPMHDGQNPTPEIPTKKKAMFKPLSVSRKPQKRKTPAETSSHTNSTAVNDAGKSGAMPKVSLFSVGETIETNVPDVPSTGFYEPIIYHNHTPDLQDPAPSFETQEEAPFANTSSVSEISSDPTHDPDSLQNIASDLNLSASARRQLLGRQTRTTGSDRSSSAIKITNFNTDEEYAANEILRQSGETVQHNPVRGIAPGKHSLKQLVNAATTQKDALEEHFAAGKRNRGEAGARYGW